jgi:serine/threonine protein kinase
MQNSKARGNDVKVKSSLMETGRVCLLTLEKITMLRWQNYSFQVNDFFSFSLAGVAGGALAGWLGECNDLLDVMSNLLMNDESNDEEVSFLLLDLAKSGAPVFAPPLALEGWPERYNRKSVIGKGHDGVCYLCDDSVTLEQVSSSFAFRNPKLLSKVVVKVLHRKRHRVTYEPDIMASLNHCNLVERRAHCWTDNDDFLALNFCENGDLCDYAFQKHRLSEAETRSILTQLCAGVSYLHERGICHLDLKLDNVFFDKQFNVKIGDFGAACYFDKCTRLTRRCGTLQYNAPERFGQRGYFGDQVDCWALGVMMYVMLQGCFPFEGGDGAQILFQMSRGVRFAKSHPSVMARDLVGRLLDTNPIERATLCSVAKHAWMLLPGVADDTNKFMESAAN